MAGILDKLTKFARSPQGQRAISTASRKAQEIARDPKTKAKVDEVRAKLAGRRRDDEPGPASQTSQDPTVHTDDTEGGAPRA